MHSPIKDVYENHNFYSFFILSILRVIFTNDPFKSAFIIDDPLFINIWNLTFCLCNSTLPFFYKYCVRDGHIYRSSNAMFISITILIFLLCFAHFSHNLLCLDVKIKIGILSHHVRATIDLVIPNVIRYKKAVVFSNVSKRLISYICKG